MPTIATDTDGSLKITMYWKDHNPPHFHVAQGDDEATVDIHDAVLTNGGLKRETLYRVLAWCVSHRAELLANWELARTQQPLNHIDWTIK